MSRLVRSSTIRRLAVLATATAVLLVGSAPALRAADSLKDDTSLKFVPDEIAFYVAGMRMREVFDKVASSNAIAKFKSIPAVQFGLAMAMAQWENPQNPQIAAFKEMLQDPQNQQLLALLKDAVSHEVFIYGDASWGEALTLLNELNAASTAAQLEAAAGGDMSELQSLQMQKMLEVLDQRGADLKIPTLVKGAKLSAVEPAVAQLARLENLLSAVLAQQPVLQQRFARESIGDSEFLTLRLDGTLIPWPMLTQNMPDADQQQVEKLVQKLSTLKLVISLGVRGDYLILSIGEDNKHLGQIGAGQLLYDRNELAPLRASADKPLTEVIYASAPFMQQIGSVDRQMDQLTAMAKQFLPMAPIGPDLQSELAADIEKFAAYVKATVPKPGAVTGFSYLTPEGYESFVYGWSTDVRLDATKNLTILSHVGGDPVAFWASRGTTDPQEYENLAMFLRRVAYYAEQLAMQQADDEQQEAFEKLREQLLPLFTQLGTVTRDKLMPAFADGQSALVLDAKTTSESWHVMLPPADGPLPMIELAMVNGVSNANLAKEAFGEYFDIAQQILDKLHELSTGELRDAFPNEVPAIQLAKPKTKDVAAGTIYFYLIPEESGLDQQIAPNGGLSEEVMVVSLLPKFTERLLANTPLQGQGPLASIDRPLAAAGQFEFARFLGAIEPWIDYGLQLAGMSDAGGQPDGNPMGNIPQQIHDALDVLKCFRGVSSVTYQEGGAVVTHAQWRFQDLQ